MATETEVKFRVRDLAAVRRRILRAGGRFLGAVVETDVYFDTPDAALRRGDRGLRIRRFRRLRGGTCDGLAPLLTYKGPRARSASAKIRPEFQARIDDPDAVEEVLKALGLRPAMIVRKRRSSFRLGRCRVELDELPRLGRFVEVEAPDERALRAACRRLQLAGRPILVPYTRLILQARRGKRR